MTTITFHGSLAKEFGKKHEYTAPTVWLTTQGLILQLGEAFKQVIHDGKWVVVRGKTDKDRTNAIFPEQVHQQLGDCKELHFYPAIEGKSRLAKIVIGVILIVVGFYLGTTWGPGLYLVKMGVALVAQGVGEYLAKKPSTGNRPDQGASNPSYFFNGGSNTTEQGVPVPLIYGRVQRAGSVVISNGVEVETVFGV